VTYFPRDGELTTIPEENRHDGNCEIIDQPDLEERTNTTASASRCVGVLRDEVRALAIIAPVT
jgi:hypothetical protein